jgi:halogenation protein CepH
VSANLDDILDLIVIGGGPAGSTVATFVAMQGHRVLLLEAERYPIYKIGESLLPATVHGICPMLGVSEALKKANFVPKRGGTFLWGKGPEPWTFLFSSSPQMAGPTSTAYQVERMKFDHILITNAKAKGVDVREQHKVTSLIVENGRAVGVQYTDDIGAFRTARAKYLVDATGYQSPIARHVGERIVSPFFQNIALFGYFHGGGRLPSPNEGNIYSVAFEHGWFWYIPLGDDLTSVGAVISKDQSSRLSHGYEAALNEFISACPAIKSLLANATRVTTGPYGQLRLRKDYSYCHDRFVADRMLLVGDAACFIDPVFSSGVHLATYSGLLAARTINTRLRDNLTDALCFDEFEMRYRREFSHFHDFLVAFYDVHQEQYSYFWEARKITGALGIPIHAFIDLVAGIGGSGERLYSSSGEIKKERQPSGKTLFPNAFNESPSENDRKERARFLSHLLREPAQVQLQAILGEERPSEQPLFPGGLVASRDGLHWSRPQ